MFRRGSNRSSHAGDRPRGVAKDVEHRREQQAPYDYRVEEHGRREAQAELLDDPVFAEHEREEYADHDRRGGRHDAAGEREPFAHSAAAVAVARPLLVDARDEEHLVIHGEAENDREQHHRHERLDRAGFDAHDPVKPPPLEDDDDHAERGADGKQVHESRL